MAEAGIEQSPTTTSSSARLRNAWHIDTVILCAAPLFFGWQPRAGFMALLTIPVVAPWLLYQGVMAAWRPARRRAFCVKVAAIAATAAVLWIVQSTSASAARRAADEAREAVMRYHAAHGAWPANLEAAGFHDLARVRRWRIHYDGGFEGAIMYQSSFNAFDKWWRQSSEAEWVFVPD